MTSSLFRGFDFLPFEEMSAAKLICQRCFLGPFWVEPAFSPRENLSDLAQTVRK
jgi:hypothetical protein